MVLLNSRPGRADVSIRICQVVSADAGKDSAVGESKRNEPAEATPGTPGTPVMSSAGSIVSSLILLKMSWALFV